MLTTLFQRRQRAPVALGGMVIAARMAGVVPPACIGVAVDAGGRTRRFAEGVRMVVAASENAWCFHPGPYNLVLTPYLAAPEMGLQLSVVVDSPDPLADQQRFDLYLASEGEQAVELTQFRQALDAAVQRELQQGGLALPPCTQVEEWQLFRAGLNELLYMRFGVTVDDCIPVDLAGQVDYAALLSQRAVADVPAAVVTAAPAPAIVPVPPGADAPALRRLFLELPPVTARLRMLDVDAFTRHRALLQRFDLASLAVLTMPALALAAPGQPLGAGQQQRRTRHALRAVAALDEAWALLARAGRVAQDEVLDEFERIAANLEDALAARRAIPLEDA